MRLTLVKTACVAAAALMLSGAAGAAERPIGEVEKSGMKIAAIYHQGIAIEPKNEVYGPDNADIYLQADVHALKNNPNGFGKGEWLPYVTASYVVTKPGSDFKALGPLPPMTSVTGPHYGRNINLAGPGTYHVAITLKAPVHNNFYRHTDKETGVSQWWEPITQEWDFKFEGAGK
jgi:uncharacterized protein involved in high-affinity Fe2+ transport